MIESGPKTTVRVEPELVNVGAAAILLGVTGPTIRRMIHGGELEAVQLESGTFLIPIAALQRLLRTRRFEPKAQR